jgi:hypothetical protein
MFLAVLQPKIHATSLMESDTHPPEKIRHRPEPPEKGEVG